MDKAKVTAALESCLLSDEELDADWEEFDNPFITLVAPADDDDESEGDADDDKAAAGDQDDIDADDADEEEDEDEEADACSAMSDVVEVVQIFRVVRRHLVPTK